MYGNIYAWLLLITVKWRKRMIEKTLSVEEHISLLDSGTIKTHICTLYLNAAIYITGYVIDGTVSYTLFFILN